MIPFISEAKRREQAALFGKHQPPKKRRKSRTAFTNQQIYELEKRFLYQKYLTPADRDEIAQNLGLSNAQVITWFQNRRAKLKRDLEELKNDVTATQILKTSSEKDDDESERSFSTDPEVSRSADEDDCEPSPAKVQRTSESEAENASEKDDSSDVDMEIHSPWCDETSCALNWLRPLNVRFSFVYTSQNVPSNPSLLSISTSGNAVYRKTTSLGQIKT